MPNPIDRDTGRVLTKLEVNRILGVETAPPPFDYFSETLNGVWTRIIELALSSYLTPGSTFHAFEPSVDQIKTHNKSCLSIMLASKQLLVCLKKSLSEMHLYVTTLSAEDRAAVSAEASLHHEHESELRYVPKAFFLPQQAYSEGD